MFNFRKRNQKLLQRNTTQDPKIVTIAYDKLRLIVNEYTRRSERANRGIAYVGAAAALWLNIIVADFSTIETTLFLTGEQWRVIYLGLTSLFTFQALIGLWHYVRKPKANEFIDKISFEGESANEYRSLFIIKRRDSDHEYKLLCYRDIVWGCYMLPHFSISNFRPSETNDPTLLAFISGMVGIDETNLRLDVYHGMNLNSWKHSEFHKTGTAYEFSFFSVTVTPSDVVPDLLKQSTFERNGREFLWLSISEMEADENTRIKNIDVTRHIYDNSSIFLVNQKDFC